MSSVPFVTVARVEPGSAAHADMLALRHRLLRRPLGLDFSQAELKAETSQVHLALWLDNQVIGTLLLVPPDATGMAKLRQMAIEPTFQRQGLGTLLMLHGEDELQRLDASTITLSARTSAVRFYEKLRYVIVGEPYSDKTIPHVRMERRLTGGT